MRPTTPALALAALLSTAALAATGCGRAALTPARAVVDPPAVESIDLEPWHGVVRVAATDLAAVERLDDSRGLVAATVAAVVEGVGVPVEVRCVDLRRTGTVASVIHAEVEVGFPSGGKEAQRAEVVGLLAAMAPTAAAFDLPAPETREAPGLLASASEAP